MEEMGEAWKQQIQQDVQEIKRDVRTLQDKTLLHDRSINDLKDDLKEIKLDLKWLRQTITKAIITATATAIIGGAIAIFYATLQN